MEAQLCGGDAIVVVGPDGLLSLVTRQAEELFGYRREELLGEPMELLVPGQHRPTGFLHIVQQDVLHRFSPGDFRRHYSPPLP